MTSEAGENLRQPIEADVALLARLLIVFATIKLVATTIGYFVALAAADGNDPDGSRTLFWMPQLLFYLLYLLAARRLSYGDAAARPRVVRLSILALIAEVLYTVAVFTFGPGREQPAFALAMELRLLVSGDIWDLIFPLVAIFRLREPRKREIVPTG